MLAFLLAAALASPGPQASPIVLRHMVFSAHVNATGNSSSTYRGVNAGESGVPASVDASGRDDGNLAVTVDVLAAPNDGSLVVRIASAKRKPLRVGITADGQIVPIDTFRPPSIAEYALLPLLARDFVVGHADDAGDAWTLPYGPDKAGQLHVRVTKVDGAHVQLALQGAAFVTTPETRRQQMHGDVTYDAAHTVPLSASVNESIATETGAGTQSLDYRARFTLESDSLGGS